MKLLDGKKVSNKIKDELKPRINLLIQINNRPGLGIILVGDNIESKIYINMKEKSCSKLGIKTELHHLPDSINQKTIIEIIQGMNNNSTLHGILVQLPLPKNLDTDLILNTVSYEKDVDGFHTLNAGKLFQNRNIEFVPCTPKGCIELLDHYNINVKGMNSVIIGCSNLIGLPISMMLLHRGATVIICHIDTKNTKELVQQADLIVSCCGVAHLVKEDWVKENAIVIDVGFNKLEDKSREQEYRLVGDVDFENVKNKVSYITPVPGGIGPMTIAMLMEQIVRAAELNMTLKL